MSISSFSLFRSPTRAKGSLGVGEKGEAERGVFWPGLTCLALEIEKKYCRRHDGRVRVLRGVLLGWRRP